MKKTLVLRDFITDEQILEVIILSETRRMDAARLLATYMEPKWRLTTVESIKLLETIINEWK